jgi:uncharacterized phiE125 gp8 family phage protein
VGLALVTGPALDPISLAEAKAHCEITSADRDGLIAGYVLSARQFVENECYLRLITQTLDYTMDEDWPCSRSTYRQRIEFPIGPVQSITSVSYVDSAGATQTLSPSDYVTRNMGTKNVSGLAFIEPAYGVSWPTVRCQSAAITVRFVAGWELSDVPNPLMQAMRMLIGHAVENREAMATGIFSQIPLGVEAFISPYRLSRVA